MSIKEHLIKNISIKPAPNSEYALISEVHVSTVTISLVKQLPYIRPVYMYMSLRTGLYITILV